MAGGSKSHCACSQAGHSPPGTPGPLCCSILFGTPLNEPFYDSVISKNRICLGAILQGFPDCRVSIPNCANPYQIQDVWNEAAKLQPLQRANFQNRIQPPLGAQSFTSNQQLVKEIVPHHPSQPFRKEVPAWLLLERWLQGCGFRV